MSQGPGPGKLLIRRSCRSSDRGGRFAIPERGSDTNLVPIRVDQSCLAHPPWRTTHCWLVRQPRARSGPCPPSLPLATWDCWHGTPGHCHVANVTRCRQLTVENKNCRDCRRISRSDDGQMIKDGSLRCVETHPTWDYWSGWPDLNRRPLRPEAKSTVSVLGNPVSSLGLSVRHCRWCTWVCAAIVTQLATQPSLRVQRWPVRKWGVAAARGHAEGAGLPSACCPAGEQDGLMRVVVTRIERDGAMQRRVVDGAPLALLPALPLASSTGAQSCTPSPWRRPAHTLAMLVRAD
jgi:hypothetical protein